MKASDLRIGNLVQPTWTIYNRSPEPYVVNGLFIRQLESQGGEACNYEGIPISEEWLEKAGFEIDNEKIYYLDVWSPGHPSARFEIEYRNDLGFMLRSRYQEYNDNLKFRLLDYVHQLQNLYFALTGEELQFKD